MTHDCLNIPTVEGRMNTICSCRDFVALTTLINFSEGPDRHWREQRKAKWLSRILVLHPSNNDIERATTILGLRNRVDKLSNGSSLWPLSRRGYKCVDMCI